MELFNATPLGLQDALEARISHLLEGKRAQDTLGRPAKVNVFTQSLPVRFGSDTGPEAVRPVPYVLVQLADGGGKPGEALTASAILTVCVGDTAPDRQGHRDVLHLLWEILRDLSAHPVLERCVEYTGEMEWQMGAVYEDVSIGAMLLRFRLGRLERERQPELEALDPLRHPDGW